MDPPGGIRGKASWQSRVRRKEPVAMECDVATLKFSEAVREASDRD